MSAKTEQLKSHIRQTIPEFLRTILSSPVRALTIVSVILFVSLLPGQNRYQTELLNNVPSALAVPSTYTPPRPYPEQDGTELPPDISAKAALVTDLESMTVLYEKNAHDPLLPASTTKLMTAWVARQNFKLDDVLVVPEIEQNGSTMNLVPGETIAVESLLKGLLIASANDGARTFSANIPGGTEHYLYLMNQWAEKMSLENTRFSNVSGIDSSDHYSSASDLAQLAAYVLSDQVLADIVATDRTVVADTTGRLIHPLRTTNQLLVVSDVYKGVKTGWTEGAGGCLVALSDNEHKILSVVLGSTDQESRFYDTLLLVNWVEQNYHWESSTVPDSIQTLSTAGT